MYMGIVQTKSFGKNGMDGTDGNAVMRTIGIRRRLEQAFAQISPISLAK